MEMAKQRAGERVVESRVFEEVMEPRQGEDHHRVGKACPDSHAVNQGGKPPGVWKTLLRVIHSVDNSTGEHMTVRFNRPRLLPFLIHLVLFQNAFQLAF
ncbi:hypothetical protein Fmac_019280 [Flemingia macrophylla]|uniref:Uncharacterized protein n=1 Tax=Flemingia macrophylla TaxID=520843 RepID=A0ABD1M7D6_9FABA